MTILKFKPKITISASFVVLCPEQPVEKNEILGQLIDEYGLFATELIKLER